jgi:hypothetical protein
MIQDHQTAAQLRVLKADFRFERRFRPWPVSSRTCTLATLLASRPSAVAR